MVIGRSEDRDTPRDPTVLEHHMKCSGPDPRNPSGPAAIAAHKGRTYDRNRPDHLRCPILARRRPSTYAPTAYLDSLRLAG